jgi:hypothetical protein
VTDFADVVEVLETGSRQQMTCLLLGLTDQQRKAFGPKFRRWLTHGHTVRVPRDRQSLAVVATAGGVRQAKLVATDGWGLPDEFIEDAVHILAERSPAWLPGFVESLLDEDGSWNWRMARGIVRAGIVPAPANPEYYRGTVHGVPDYNARDHRPLIDQLDRDPGLIGDHLISMLSTEATGRLLRYHDNFVESTHSHLPDLTPSPAGTWRVTLLVLSQEGRLDRGQLLDVVLAAPMRDWAAADLGWYAGMHDALGPSIDEVVARQATYARLLTVEHGPSVKVAQREIGRILGDKRFEPALVIDASSATLGRSDKAIVAAQLRLLEKLHKAHSDLQVADTIRIAAEHPRADIREQTAKMLGRLGEAPGKREPGPPFAVPALEPRPISHAVEPVGSADELAEVLLALIEDIDPIEMERAIDGLLRFADDRPRTADLLLARAAQGDFYYDDPRVAPVVLSRAWLTPRKRLRGGEWPILLGHTVFPANPASPETLVGALGRRLTGVAHAVRSGPHLSVALPSRADGSLDADTLSMRLSTAGRRQQPSELELALALLRVSPQGRQHVVIPSSFRKARLVTRVLTSPAPTWDRQVVSHHRMKWEPERNIPVYRDRVAREGDALDGFLSRRQPERTVGGEVKYGEYEPRFEQTLALAAVLLPHDLDVLAAHAHPYLHRDLRKDRAMSVPILDALSRSSTGNGDPESSALVLGLAAKDARSRTAAQDAMLDLARHGLLDGVSLGRQAALHLEDEIVVGQRVSNGLAEVARAGDVAIIPVLDALQHLLVALPGRKDAGPFVEMVADLSQRAGRRVELTEELRVLASGKSMSMLARAARRLL